MEMYVKLDRIGGMNGSEIYFYPARETMYRYYKGDKVYWCEFSAGTFLV